MSQVRTASIKVFMDIWTDKKLTREISKIPPDNKLKFFLDLQHLVISAKKGDYVNKTLILRGIKSLDS